MVRRGFSELVTWQIVQPGSASPEGAAGDAGDGAEEGGEILVEVVAQTDGVDGDRLVLLAEPIDALRDGRIKAARVGIGRGPVGKQDNRVEILVGVSLAKRS